MEVYRIIYPIVHRVVIVYKRKPIKKQVHFRVVSRTYSLNFHRNDCYSLFVHLIDRHSNNLVVVSSVVFVGLRIVLY